MSDVVRNYTRGSNPRRRRRDLRRRGTGIAKFMIPLVLLLLIWGLWSTRNNYDRTSFIPQNPAVEIYVSDIVAKQSKIAESNLGKLIPESTQVRSYWDNVAGELPAPEWLLNNLSADLCHIYGMGLEQPEALVVTTQMTRIGRIAERVIRFYSGIEEDFAGGLYLYRVPDLDLYYAVRGRVLIASFSRAQLIHALTLRSDDTLPLAQFSENTRKALKTDVFICMQGDVPNISIPFSNMEASLRIEPDTALMSFQGNLAPEFMGQYAPFLTTVTPQKLPEPFDSMATASINLGIPFPDVIETLRDVHPAFESISDFLASSTEDEASLSPVADVTTLFKETLRMTGAKTRIAWFGMDPYEMLPMPSLAASFDASPDQVLALFERIEPSSKVIEEVDLTLRLDEDVLLAYSPVVGGQNIEPAVASYGSGILISSSATQAREITKSPQLLQTHSQEGNLYLAIKPYPVTLACVDAARELAFSGLLRGYNEASLDKAAQPFLNTTSKVDNVILFTTCNQGLIQMNMKLDMATPQNSTEKPIAENGSADEQAIN